MQKITDMLSSNHHSSLVLTLYRIVKRVVAESVPDRASAHTRNVAFEAVSAPEQYCSVPLPKVERSLVR